MRFSLQKAENRREFVRSAARYGLLGLLAAVGAVAARTSKASGQRCVNRGICSGCAQFEGCGLPQALSAKSLSRQGSEAARPPRRGGPTTIGSEQARG